MYCHLLKIQIIYEHRALVKKKVVLQLLFISVYTYVLNVIHIDTAEPFLFHLGMGTNIELFKDSKIGWIYLNYKTKYLCEILHFTGSFFGRVARVQNRLIKWWMSGGRGNNFGNTLLNNYLS